MSSNENFESSIPKTIIGTTDKLQVNETVTQVADVLSTNVKKSLECPICQEEFFSLKYLCCDHLMCETCIQAISVSEGRKKMVKCPFDRTMTEIPCGDAVFLKTKLMAELYCETCTVLHLTNKLWWCKQCQMTLCSQCAMRKHRIHQCNPWEDYDIVADCTDFFRTKSMRSPSECEKLKRDIVEFCSKLQNTLTRSVNEEEDAWKKISYLTQTFGSVVIRDETRVNDFGNIQKKLKLISKVVPGEEERKPELSYDVSDQMLPCPVELPRLEEVLSLCLSKTTPQCPTKSVETKLVLQTSGSLNSQCTCPFAMCFLNETVMVVVTLNGLRVINVQSGNILLSKSWETAFSKPCEGYPWQVECSTDKKSICVRGVFEIDKKKKGALIKYDKSLSKISSVIIPSDYKNAVMCFVKDIPVVLKSTESKTIIRKLVKINDWEIIWRKDRQNDLQPFSFCLPLIEENQICIYVASHDFVYKFYFTNTFTFQRYETIRCSGGPMIMLNQSIWVLGRSQNGCIDGRTLREITNNRCVKLEIDEYLCPKILTLVKNNSICMMNSTRTKVLIFSLV